LGFDDFTHKFHVLRVFVHGKIVNLHKVHFAHQFIDFGKDWSENVVGLTHVGNEIKLFVSGVVVPLYQFQFINLIDELILLSGEGLDHKFKAFPLETYACFEVCHYIMANVDNLKV
jgi:hypothetical protein